MCVARETRLEDAHRCASAACIVMHRLALGAEQAEESAFFFLGFVFALIGNQMCESAVLLCCLRVSHF